MLVRVQQLASVPGMEPAGAPLRQGLEPGQVPRLRQGAKRPACLPKHLGKMLK